MLRIGIISEMGTGEYSGFARVWFEEKGMVSHWLSLPAHGTKDTRCWTPLSVNSQVACLVDDRCEQGVIVGALWSDTDTPPAWASEHTLGILFPDGAEIYYDWEAHTLTANAPDAELNFRCKALNIEGEVNITGDTKVSGDITATGEVTAGPENIKLTKHTHTTAVGPTGTPIPG